MKVNMVLFIREVLMHSTIQEKLSCFFLINKQGQARGKKFLTTQQRYQVTFDIWYVGSKDDGCLKNLFELNNIGSVTSDIEWVSQLLQFMA